MGRREFSEAIFEGRSGVNYIESFDTSGLSIKIAGEVKNFDARPYLGEHKKNLKLMSRAVRFGVGAAAMAVEDAALETNRLDPGRFGVCMGAGITPVDVGELVNPILRSVDKDGAFDMGRFALARAESIFPLWLLQHLPNMAAAHISILQHAMGPNNTIVTACAAGTQAVGEAFRLIARGDADTVRGHLAVLAKAPVAVDRLYRAAGLATLGIARQRGLAEVQAGAIEEILRKGERRD